MLHELDKPEQVPVKVREVSLRDLLKKKKKKKNTNKAANKPMPPGVLTYCVVI